jgi:hypothetical protein
VKTHAISRIIAAATFTALAASCGTTPPAGDPGDCVIDRDCTNGAYCDANGRCAQDCSLPSDCGADETCTENGRCIPDGEGACTEDTECRTPPDGATTACEGNDLVTSGFVGTCAAGECAYEQSADAEVRVPCDNGCDPASNTCNPPENPCAGVTCTEPPAAECKDADNLFTYAQVGMCTNDGGTGVCNYMRTEVNCPSGCENGACNQGTCDGVQCGTPPQPTCDPADSDVSIVYDAVGMCVDNAGAPECQYDTTRTDCRYLGGDCDANSGVCDNTIAQSGEIVITEYMGDPASDQGSREWIELLNTTGAEINLNGWRLRSAGPNNSTEEHVIATDVPVPAGGYVLLSNGADPLGDGTAPAYVYADVTLFFVDYLEVIKADASTSDYVYWEGGSTMPARSRKIGEASALTAAANDQVSNWCSSLTDAIGDGFGTPGAPNTACAVDPCAGFDCGSKPDPFCNGDGDVVDYGLDVPACRPTRFNNPFCDFQEFETACDASANVCLAGVCEAFPANLPAPGEVIITEIMGAPAGTDGDFEYIELYNTTAGALPLFSLKLEDNEAGNLYSFSDLLDDPGLTIPANGYVVLATNIDPATNGGITGAVELKSGILKNTPPVDGGGISTMTLRLVTQDGTLIDEAYYGTPTEGASQQLSSDLYDGVAGGETANDAAAGFCDTTAGTTYGPSTNLGTPGAANQDCTP